MTDPDHAAVDPAERNRVGRAIVARHLGGPAGRGGLGSLAASALRFARSWGRPAHVRRQLALPAARPAARLRHVVAAPTTVPALAPPLEPRPPRWWGGPLADDDALPDRGLRRVVRRMPDEHTPAAASSRLAPRTVPMRMPPEVDAVGRMTGPADSRPRQVSRALAGPPAGGPPGNVRGAGSRADHDAGPDRSAAEGTTAPPTPHTPLPPTGAAPTVSRLLRRRAAARLGRSRPGRPAHDGAPRLAGPTTTSRGDAVRRLVPAASSAAPPGPAGTRPAVGTASVARPAAVAPATTVADPGAAGTDADGPAPAHQIGAASGGSTTPGEDRTALPHAGHPGRTLRPLAGPVRRTMTSRAAARADTVPRGARPVRHEVSGVPDSARVPAPPGVGLGPEVAWDGRPAGRAPGVTTAGPRPAPAAPGAPATPTSADPVLPTALGTTRGPDLRRSAGPGTGAGAAPPASATTGALPAPASSDRVPDHGAAELSRLPGTGHRRASIRRHARPIGSDSPGLRRPTTVAPGPLAAPGAVRPTAQHAAARTAGVPAGAESVRRSAPHARETRTPGATPAPTRPPAPGIAPGPVLTESARPGPVGATARALAPVPVRAAGPPSSSAPGAVSDGPVVRRSPGARPHVRQAVPSGAGRADVTPGATPPPAPAVARLGTGHPPSSGPAARGTEPAVVRRVPTGLPSVPSFTSAPPLAAVGPRPVDHHPGTPPAPGPAHRATPVRRAFASPTAPTFFPAPPGTPASAGAAHGTRHRDEGSDVQPHLRPDPTTSGVSPDLLVSEVEQRVVARLEQWIASDLDERVIELVEQRIEEETERRSWRLGTEVF